MLGESSNRSSATASRLRKITSSVHKPALLLDFNLKQLLHDLEQEASRSSPEALERLLYPELNGEEEIWPVLKRVLTTYELSPSYAASLIFGLYLLLSVVCLVFAHFQLSLSVPSPLQLPKQVLSPVNSQLISGSLFVTYLKQFNLKRLDRLILVISVITPIYFMALMRAACKRMKRLIDLIVYSIASRLSIKLSAQTAPEFQAFVPTAIQKIEDEFQVSSLSIPSLLSAAQVQINSLVEAHELAVEELAQQCQSWDLFCSPRGSSPVKMRLEAEAVSAWRWYRFWIYNFPVIVVFCLYGILGACTNLIPAYYEALLTPQSLPLSLLHPIEALGNHGLRCIMTVLLLHLIIFYYACIVDSYDCMLWSLETSRIFEKVAQQGVWMINSKISSIWDALLLQQLASQLSQR